MTALYCLLSFWAGGLFATVGMCVVQVGKKADQDLCRVPVSETA